MGALVLDFNTGERLKAVDTPQTDYERLYEQYTGIDIRESDWAEEVKKAFISYCRRGVNDQPIEYYLEMGQLSNKTCTTFDGEKAVLYKNFGDYPLAAGIPTNPLEDPFAHHDRKYKTTLALLNTAQKAIEIQTRSDLIANDQYLNEIPRYSTIKVYLTSKDNEEEWRKKGFPSNKRLNKAIAKIKEQRPDITIKKYYTNK